jgi:ABC-type uncharacterized transport system ATPase subunit
MLDAAQPARLSLRGIRKAYPAVVANDGVDLTVKPGEIHAVLGENGAGKSTLMKVIYGVVRPDEGRIEWDGSAVQVASPKAARALGISMVFQHFSLFDTLSVAENVALGQDAAMPLSAVRERVVSVSREYGLEVDPDRPVHSLSVGERQRVELTRALLGSPRLLILDEPTSVLTPQAVDRLFDTLRVLAAGGCSILYISHKLDEIRRLCEACTVLRGGRVVGHADPRVASEADLSRLMIGDEPPKLERRAPRTGALALEVRGLTLRASEPFGTDLHGVSLELREGEILGIAGVSGNGQRELLAAIAGEDRRAPHQAIHIAGEAAGDAGPSARRRLGLRYVPEERLGHATVPSHSLADNVLLTRTGPQTLRGGWIRRAGLAAIADEVIRRFNVKAGGNGALASSLSGGNLQKYIVGREVSAEPRILIVSQPTWGVDIGATAQIRAELLALRERGTAILVVSEELDELFEIADRLQVIARGRLSPSVPTADMGVEKIGLWMSGLWDGAQDANADKDADHAAA